MINLTFRKSMVRLCFVFGGILTIIELCCYLAYFQYIYNHDNKVAAMVISQTMIRIRNKTNAISMVGQVTSWVMEIWYAVLIVMLSTFYDTDTLREIASLIKDFEFVFIPLVEVQTSSPIIKFLSQKNK